MPTLSSKTRKSLIVKEPLMRIELMTYSLRVNCSTPELQRPMPISSTTKSVYHRKISWQAQQYQRRGHLDKDPQIAYLFCVNPTLHADFLTQSKARRYLLGISGGRDSVALLHLLLDAGYRNIVLCHLNHSLRGRASGQDAALVSRLGKKYDLQCETERVNIPKQMSQKSGSMELLARNARHQFFANCARKYRCKRILLAHHADDQAETVLFNLLRGSYGLKGMHFSTTHHISGKELELQRPLLEINREDINEYLEHHKIAYRDDASNAESITTRNRIRNEAIPLLNEIMGREVRPAILRATSASQAQQSGINSTLETLQLNDPQGRLYLPKIVQLSPAMRSSAMHHYLKAHDISDINLDLLAKCDELITSKDKAKVNLPGGKFLRRKEKRIFIS